MHDPRHNPAGHSIHNHFIIKSLALTKPGGLVVLLTSRYTLDARNPSARHDMSDLGDLLAAVRLPTGAHRRMAGTDALTDLLVFRRRQPGTAPTTSTSWLRTREIDLAGGSQRVNEHFIEHPDHVLGELTVGHGMYGAQTLRVKGTVDPAVVAQHIEAITGELVDETPRVRPVGRRRVTCRLRRRWFSRRRGCGTGICWCWPTAASPRSRTDSRCRWRCRARSAASSGTWSGCATGPAAAEPRSRNDRGHATDHRAARAAADRLRAVRRPVRGVEPG